MSKVLQVRQDMCRKFHDFLKSQRQATCHFGPAIGDSMGDEQVVVSVELHSEYYSITVSTTLEYLWTDVNTNGPKKPALEACTTTRPLSKYICRRTTSMVFIHAEQCRTEKNIKGFSSFYVHAAAFSTPHWKEG